MPWKFSLQGMALAVVVAVTPVAASAQDPKNCRLQKIAEWQVRSIGRHMAVDGAINGKKIGIVIDTGASVSLLFRTAARRLDLPLTEARGQRIYGVGGESKVEIASIDEFKLGNAAVRGMELRVAGERDPGEGFDLLLGEDFLRNFDIEFDLAHDALRLWQPKDCEGASLAYWTQDTPGEVDIEAVTDRQRKIAFVVRLNDKRIDALLDSGASASAVSTQDAEKVGGVLGAAAGRSAGVGGKTVDARIGAFATFAIGNESIPDVRIRVADLFQGAARTSTGSAIARNAFEGEPMVLGADFLRAHRTLVAHSQRKLYFTYTGGPVFAVPGALR